MTDEHSYEALMARCLGRVSTEVDKREGSILYDALAPACAELAVLYTELETMLDRAWPDTAAGADLDKKAAERSLVRAPADGIAVAIANKVVPRSEPASSAVREGRFTGADGGAFDVPIGTRFSGGAVNFTVTERREAGVFRLTAETPGSAGNTWFGTLFPIDYVEGLAGAELGEVLVPGDDAEDDESLRARYFGSFESQAFGGNRADYREKVLSLPGVGGVKIFRTPEGGGTVGLTLVDSLWGVPSDDLVAAVQAAIDPVSGQGDGAGLAPIGHTVTVRPAVGKTIDVALTLTLEGSLTWEAVRPDAEAALRAYFAELVQGWADASGLTVRLSQVETRMLDIPGVLDVQGTRLNGGLANVTLEEEEIPVLGVMSHGA